MMKVKYLIRVLTLCAAVLAAASTILGFISVFASGSGRGNTRPDNYILAYDSDFISLSVTDYMNSELNTSDSERRIQVYAGGDLDTFNGAWYIFYRSSCDEESCLSRNPTTSFPLSQSRLDSITPSQLPRRPGYVELQASHITVEAEILGSGGRASSLTDDESTRVQNLTDSIDEYVSSWAAQDIINTSGPFTALCVGIGFSLLATLGLVFIFIKVNHSTLLVNSILAAISLAAAISFTISQATIAQLIQDRVGTYDMFDGRIPGGTISITDARQFRVFSIVPVVLLWLCLGVANAMIGIRFWENRTANREPVGKETG